MLNESGREKFAGATKLAINNFFHDYLLKFIENTVSPKKWRYLEELPQNTEGKIRMRDIQALFGLAESPVFECETVGVGNIKGAKIEVFCEVFCDSTVTGAEWKNDLMAYVYAIPYGVFIVDSCKRQADMIHRKITAYGGTARINNGLGVIEKDKIHYKFSSNPQYKPNLAGLIFGNL